MIQLDLNNGQRKAVLRIAPPWAWLIPYNFATTLLNLPLASARKRVEKLIRDGNPGHLNLGQGYSLLAWRWGFVLRPYRNGSNYQPIVTLKLSSCGVGTAVGIALFSMHTPLLLVWLTVMTTAIFGHWVEMSAIVLLALGFHMRFSALCTPEQQDAVDDLIGLFSDAIITQKTS